VSEEERRRIEEEAGDDMSVSDWCRDAALEKLKSLREAAEIARIGYLIEHGFGIQLSANRTTDEEWIRRKKESKSVAVRLVEMMLERKSSGAGIG
jgi:hypothetical protein